MTPEKQIYAYHIPDDLFLPHKVTGSFCAKVVYTIDKGKIKIEEVGLSIKCLLHINNAATLAIKIENELNDKVRKAINLSNINKTIASALAPHVT